jgi:hypothetical protein
MNKVIKIIFCCGFCLVFAGKVKAVDEFVMVEPEHQNSFVDSIKNIIRDFYNGIKEDVDRTVLYNECIIKIDQKMNLDDKMLAMVEQAARDEISAIMAEEEQNIASQRGMAILSQADEDRLDTLKEELLSFVSRIDDFLLALLIKQKNDIVAKILPAINKSIATFGARVLAIVNKSSFNKQLYPSQIQGISDVDWKLYFDQIKDVLSSQYNERCKNGLLSSDQLVGGVDFGDIRGFPILAIQKLLMKDGSGLVAAEKKLKMVMRNFFAYRSDDIDSIMQQIISEIYSMRKQVLAAYCTLMRDVIRITGLVYTTHVYGQEKYIPMPWYEKRILKFKNEMIKHAQIQLKTKEVPDEIMKYITLVCNQALWSQRWAFTNKMLQNKINDLFKESIPILDQLILQDLQQ